MVNAATYPSLGTTNAMTEGCDKSLVGRAASLRSPWLAVSANALGALVMPLLLPALGTATYNRDKASPCTLRFHMATEGGWDVGYF